MPMSPRLLRPRASGSALHPDALDWITRVTANGGTASTNTLAAVSTFCAAIDAAGIRDRFVRLNLLCGNSDASLAAVRTPLYRGSSLSGTQRGLTIDTNANFVAGDYAETGASGGLKNSASNHLLAGDMSVMTADSAHMMAYGSDFTAGSGDQFAMGAGGSGFAALYGLQMGGIGHRAYVNNSSPSGIPTGFTSPTNGMIVASATTATSFSLYRNGAANSVEATQNRGTAALSNVSLAIFGYNNNGTVDRNSRARLRAYSVGFGMTESQVSAYYTAMQGFQTALGRQV